jgi:hypothetical protein
MRPLSISPVAFPVAAGVPCRIALVASSEAMTTASSISASRCHLRSVATVNVRAARADSGTGASPIRRRRPAVGGADAAGCLEL